MDGLNHYLQSSTQGAMIAPTQKSTKQPTMQLTHPHDDDEPPQYFSNSMSVLPADRYGSYYIIYHRGVSGDCIDAEASSNSNGSSSRREEHGVEQPGVTSERQDRTAPKTNVKFIGTKIYDERQRRGPSPRAICMQEQDDEDEYEYYDGCASHAAEACVASSIPVLHFIQYFMC